MGVVYKPLKDVILAADIISLHCPSMPLTYHAINKQSLSQLKPGAMVIDTSRGGLLDTKAVIQAIKTGQVDYLGMALLHE